MANTFTKVYKKTANTGAASDYTLVAQVGVGGVPLQVMSAASSSANGVQGLVPAPTRGNQSKFLRGDATWATPTNTTYATTTSVTSGSSSLITSGGVYSKLGLASTENFIVNGTTYATVKAAIEALNSKTKMIEFRSSSGSGDTLLKNIEERYALMVTNDGSFAVLDTQTDKSKRYAISYPYYVSHLSINTGASMSGSGTIRSYASIASITLTVKSPITGTNLNVANIPSDLKDYICPYEDTWLSCDYYGSDAKHAEAKITNNGIIILSTPISNVDFKISGMWFIKQIPPNWYWV